MKTSLGFGLCFFCFASVSIAVQAASSETNSPPSLLQGPSLADFIRLIGALVLVISIFLTAAWFFRRSRFYSIYQGKPAQLKILENKSLGQRNALAVVGYSDQRFLIGISGAGINLISRLPDEKEAEGTGASFADHLNALEQKKA